MQQKLWKDVPHYFEDISNFSCHAWTFLFKTAQNVVYKLRTKVPFIREKNKF